jgi:hypothetical protein
VGRRARKRSRDAAEPPAAGGSTTDRPLGDDGSLTLRDELSAGTLRKLADLDARPAANAEDRWQRRVEFLFERLVVRWEIAGLPLEGQRELLGRFRLASAEERAAVTGVLEEHLRERHPDAAR